MTAVDAASSSSSSSSSVVINGCGAGAAPCRRSDSVHRGRRAVRLAQRLPQHDAAERRTVGVQLARVRAPTAPPAAPLHAAAARQLPPCRRPVHASTRGGSTLCPS